MMSGKIVHVPSPVRQYCSGSQDQDQADDVVQGCSPAAGGRQTGARLVDDGVVHAVSCQVQSGGTSRRALLMAWLAVMERFISSRAL